MIDKNDSEQDNMPSLPAAVNDDDELNMCEAGDEGGQKAKHTSARKLKKKPTPHYLTGTAASRG